MKGNLKANDIIIEVDGKRDRMTMGQFTAYVTREKKPGSTLELVARREGKERKIKVRVQ